MDKRTTKYFKRLTELELALSRKILTKVVEYLPKEVVNGNISLVKQKDWIAVPIASTPSSDN